MPCSRCGKMLTSDYYCVACVRQMVRVASSIRGCVCLECGLPRSEDVPEDWECRKNHKVRTDEPGDTHEDLR